MPPKPGGTLRAADGLQVPGTAPPSARRAARATRTPACLPPARFSRAYPPVAAAPLRVNGCHTTRPRALTRGACMRTPYRPGTGLPHGVERRYHPAHVWQALSAEPVVNSRRPRSSGPVRSPPLVYRSGILSASAPAAASQAPCGPDALAAVFKKRSGCGRSALRFFSRYPGDPAARGEKARAPRSAPRSEPHGLHASAAALQPYLHRTFR